MLTAVIFCLNPLHEYFHDFECKLVDWFVSVQVLLVQMHGKPVRDVSLSFFEVDPAHRHLVDKRAVLGCRTEYAKQLDVYLVFIQLGSSDWAGVDQSLDQ